MIIKIINYQFFILIIQSNHHLNNKYDKFVYIWMVQTQPYLSSKFCDFCFEPDRSNDRHNAKTRQICKLWTVNFHLFNCLALVPAIF